MALDKPYMDVPGTTIFDAEMSRQALGAAEREPAGAQHFAQALEVDWPVFERHHQPHLLLLVAQEEVLDVMARQIAAQRLGLLDGEHRRMLDGALGDAELLQAGE